MLTKLDSKVNLHNSGYGFRLINLKNEFMAISAINHEELGAVFIYENNELIKTISPLDFNREGYSFGDSILYWNKHDLLLISDNIFDNGSVYVYDNNFKPITVLKPSYLKKDYKGNFGRKIYIENDLLYVYDSTDETLYEFNYDNGFFETNLEKIPRKSLTIKHYNGNYGEYYVVKNESVIVYDCTGKEKQVLSGFENTSEFGKAVAFIADKLAISCLNDNKHRLPNEEVYLCQTLRHK
jgi:hypothetical protein